MSQKAPYGRPNIFPGLRYEDAPAAIEWLSSAFGFEKQMVVPGPNGTIAHAQMKFGPGVIMLGSSKDDDLGVKTPRRLGGVSQAPYIYVADVDAHYQRAKASGAEIAIDLQDTSYGSREYSARDPEGHLWHFGTYLPEDATGNETATP
jgi:uncharacterized glyoxalase superfamily protein PhnB